MEYRSQYDSDRFPEGEGETNTGADTLIIWHQGVHAALGARNDHAIVYSGNSMNGHYAVIDGGDGRDMLSIRNNEAEQLVFTDLLDGWIQVADASGPLVTFRDIEIIRLGNGKEIHFGDQNDPNDLEEALARQSTATLSISRQGDPTSRDMTIHRGSSRD